MNASDEPELNSQAPRVSCNQRGSSRKGMHIATTAGMALGLTVGGATIAGAASTGKGTTRPHHAGKYSSEGHMHPTVFGTVATVGSETFTVTTHSGSTMKVDVTKATTYRDREVVTPSFSNVKVAEMVAVFGTDTAGRVAATSVGIGTPGGRRGGS
jgi:hypothetical protein